MTGTRRNSATSSRLTPGGTCLEAMGVEAYGAVQVELVRDRFPGRGWR
jgi:hypothetical protein